MAQLQARLSRRKTDAAVETVAVPSHN